MEDKKVEEEYRTAWIEAEYIVTSWRAIPQKEAERR